MSKLTRYQDYIIKDGKYIGDVDLMYQDFDDPWEHGKENPLCNARAMMIHNLKKYSVESILEVGCGLGFNMSLIKESLPNITMTGIDISPVAIERGKKLHPDLNLRVGGLNDLSHFQGYQVIIFADVLWYILEDIHRWYEAIEQNFKGQLFMNNVTFYAPGKQSYGREYFTTPEGFIDHCPFDIIESNTSNNYNDKKEISTVRSHILFKV